MAREYIHVYEIPYDMYVLTALPRVCAAPLRLARRAAWAEEAQATLTRLSGIYC